MFSSGPERKAPDNQDRENAKSKNSRKFKKVSILPAIHAAKRRLTAAGLHGPVAAHKTTFEAAKQKGEAASRPESMRTGPLEM